jgi:hypothetical protein
MLRPAIVALTFILFQSAHAELRIDCTPTREYVATLGFLRSEKEISFKEPEARKIAEQVSGHCSGASDRFIRVVRMLRKAGMPSTEAVQLGLEMAAADEKTASTFVTVFNHAFQPAFLDLSLSASLRITRSLSLDFAGDVVTVGHDFEQLAKFCAEEKLLGLPRQECAAWSAGLSKKGQNVSGGVAKPFLFAFRYLVSRDGPGVPYTQAATIAQELIEISPHSVKNFIQAYQFGVSKDGLNLSSSGALQFAQKMARQTRRQRS